MSETPPPTPADRTRVPDSIAPDAGGTIVGFRHDLKARVRQPQQKAPVVIPVPLPGMMGDSMNDYLRRYQYPLGPELEKELVDQYASVGRAARRLQTVRERPPLKDQAEETMRFVRVGLGRGLIDPFIAHVDALESKVAEIMQGISAEGVGHTVSEYGIYSGPFAAEMEGLLHLLERGWQEVNRQLEGLSPDYASVNERENPAQSLADFLANALFMKQFTANPGRALMQLQEKLQPFGTEENTPLLVEIKRMGDNLPGTMTLSDVTERVYPRVEDLMHDIFRDRLIVLMDRPLEERAEKMRELKFLLLTLIKYSLYNRHRGLVKPYSRILLTPEGSKAGRGLDAYDPPLAGVRELYRFLHQAMNSVRSEAQLKKYLQPNR